MDELTEYQPSRGSLTTADIQNYHPLDVLWHINPEIASLAYANREKWLTPEIAPYIAMFRQCQTQEKIAIVRSIVDKLAIESDERKNELVAQTQERISRFEREGAIVQESIKAKAIVDAQQIGYQTALDTQIIKSETALQIQKLKYEAARLFLDKNAETHKYLSDNQLKATRIEAEALRDMIISAEQIRADAQNKATQASLIEKITTAEFQYLAKLKEAEVARQNSEQESHTAITQAYLFAQAVITRAALSVEVAKIEAVSLADQASYKALSEIAKNGAGVLKANKAKRFTFRGNTKHGEIGFEMEVDDGK